MNSLRAVFLFVAIAPRVSAQIHPHPAIADSSPVAIMARVGTQAGAPWLRDVLRQADAEYPRAKLDQIGDSLVARANDARSAEPTSEAEKRAVDAVNALVLAGANTGLRGRPYLGAFDRLIAVYQQSSARNVQIRALSGMLAVSSTGTHAVDYLSSVAGSNDLAGYYAVEFLITEANGGSWTGIQPSTSQQQQAISALKALASSRRVGNPTGAQLLDTWIQRYQAEHP